MKKETRVRDLSITLAALLMKQVDFNVDWSEVLEMDAMPFLQLIDWTKATDAERLAYCEARYPIGVNGKDAFDGEVFTRRSSENNFHLEKDPRSPHDILMNVPDDVVDITIYDGDTGKFAEIIEDEVKEPLFKVGDRPQWTPELIKQLPHGTVLECAYKSNEFIYNGEELESNDTVENEIVISKKEGLYMNYRWFFDGDTNDYAKIISLPESKSIKDQLKGTCVLNESVEMGAEIVKLYTAAGIENRYAYTGENKSGYYGSTKDGFITWEGSCDYFAQVLTLDQLRSIVRGEKEQKLKEFTDKLSKEPNPNIKFNIDPVGESVEFKEGEMVQDELVEARFTDKCFSTLKWTLEGVTIDKKYFIVKAYEDSDTLKKGSISYAVEIRKIDQDADIRKKAESIVDVWLAFGGSEQEQEAKRVTINAVVSGIKLGKESI